MRVRPIKTKADYEAAMARIERLWDAAPGSEDADTLEVLAVLVDAYENEHAEILPPNPIDAILFRMEQQGMARADLQEVLGVSRGRLSEVLSGKRGLSKAMIQRLVDQLDIPAEILIQPAR
jgi:HTH-type transcriptional regulator/antitoxin HigA